MTGQAKCRVGILGGTFDPVHNGHLGLAAGVRNQFHLDRILFIPARQSPHKQGQPLTSSFHRLEMLRRAVSPFPGFQVSDIELKREGVSYTIDTLDTLGAEHPRWEFYLIMGADVFEGLSTWKDTARLLAMSHIIVAARPGYTLNCMEKTLKSLSSGAPVLYSPEKREDGTTVFHQGETGTTLSFFNLEPLNISASDIRDRIRKKREIKNMLPPEVENYIMKNQLYRVES
ncbi:MAG: nicotinate-nucleotide adenylyltransferase [Nitrospinaceae bacterium]